MVRRPDPPPRPIEWSLPHEGSALPTCGEVRFEGHYAGNSVWHGRSYRADCATFECPTCRCELDALGKVVDARGWEHRGAISIDNRIRRAREERFERGRPIHAVVSPAPAQALEDASTLGGFRRLRSRAVKFARRAGLRGGALVYHHLRIPSRWNERTGCDDGPHFHALGYGWIDGGAVEYETNGRWIVKNLGVRKSVYSTALYLLSHATRPHEPGYPAQERGTDPYLALATTWFGTLSYNKMPLDERDELESGRYCEICDIVFPRDQWEQIEPRPGCGPPDGKRWFFIHELELQVLVDDFELARRYGPMTRDARTSGVYKVRSREAHP